MGFSMGLLSQPSIPGFQVKKGRAVPDLQAPRRASGHGSGTTETETHRILHNVLVR